MAYTHRFTLDRRTLLRGVLGAGTACVALPALEAMFDRHGEALAQGRPAPKRFLLWFWGNGVRRAQWIPDGTGPGWRPRAELQPLADLPGLREYVTPVTGLEVKTDRHPHHSGMAGILTGAVYRRLGTTRDTIVSTMAAPTIDQVIAQRWYDNPATRAPFRSLEVGVCRFRGSDEGTTFQHLSHNGPSSPNPSEYDPSRLFRRLFGMGVAAQAAAARQSVLDAVRQDLGALGTRVGAADRARLEQHTESVRSIERRLAMESTGAACTTPRAPPAEGYPDLAGREQLEARNQVLSDLVAHAFACDLTRVASVQFSTCGAGTVFWMAGATNGLHQTCHDERSPGAELQPTVHRATVFTMAQLAYLLGRLKDTREGAGNVLDRTVALCTTELSEGNTHTNDEFPVLFAGRGGGSLRSGVHHRAPSRQNATAALLTALRACGDPRGSYGAGAGATSEVLPILT